MKTAQLDKIDCHILYLLQSDGRLSNLDIAERVHLSPSSCMRRIRRLEAVGVIQRYVALLDPLHLGLGLQVFVNVRLEKQGGAARGKAPAELFRAAAQTWPEVIGCYAMTGEMDYLVRMVIKDMAHFSRFIQEQLLRHPAVIDVKSSFVLENIKETTALPLNP